MKSIPEFQFPIPITVISVGTINYIKFSHNIKNNRTTLVSSSIEAILLSIKLLRQATASISKHCKIVQNQETNH